MRGRMTSRSADYSSLSYSIKLVAVETGIEGDDADDSSLSCIVALIADETGAEGDDEIQSSSQQPQLHDRVKPAPYPLQRIPKG